MIKKLMLNFMAISSITMLQASLPEDFKNQKQRTAAWKQTTRPALAPSQDGPGVQLFPARLTTPPNQMRQTRSTPPNQTQAHADARGIAIRPDYSTTL